MRNGAILVLTIAVLITICGSCKHEPYTVDRTDSADQYGNFPIEIGKILVNRCATAGCHNPKSYKNAAGLLLDSWEHLFDGGSSGAVVIPYNTENSSLLFYINPDSIGPKAAPQMPLNSTPLTISEYLAIKKWISDGAPDKNGNIPFASDPDTRQKVYLTNQGCDLLSVIDCRSGVVMRYIPVGTKNGIEVPHYVKVSSDGYAYVSFTAGTVLQKIDTRTDKIVGNIEIGPGSWNAFHLSNDGKKMLLSDYDPVGRLLFIDTELMQIEQDISGVGLIYPHGIASNPSFDTFYVTSQIGNSVYKLTLNGGFFLDQISIDGNIPNSLPSRNPHEIIMAPDHSKYFLSCDKSNEIRVMNSHTDEVIDSIPVGNFPQTMAISKIKPYLFVTCTEDPSQSPGFHGSVYVVNYLTHEIVKRIDGPFYQPHAVSIDDQNGLVFIASRNVNLAGPAPHHTSSCAGRNGYYTIYDLNTLEKLPKRFELSVDPYSSDIRFR